MEKLLCYSGLIEVLQQYVQHEKCANGQNAQLESTKQTPQSHSPGVQYSSHPPLMHPNTAESPELLQVDRLRVQS